MRDTEQEADGGDVGQGTGPVAALKLRVFRPLAGGVRPPVVQYRVHTYTLQIQPGTCSSPAAAPPGPTAALGPSERRRGKTWREGRCYSISFFWF